MKKLLLALFSMKPLFKFLIIFQLFFILVISCNTEQKKPVVIEKPKIDSVITYPKIVFLVIGKNIDFDKMEIDTIIKKILVSDSILLIKPISPEVQMQPKIVKVYKIDNITCPYLKKRFKDFEPGYVVYQYGDKILVKAKNGVIKIYHYDMNEIKN